MADIKDEEHLDNPINNPSENPPDEIISTNDPETINSNQESENMEVHHHTHDPATPHHKKNWNSYFWEFLMLFLAVFCGFLAENIREHKIEQERAKKLATSLYNDFITDRDNINGIINARNDWNKTLDTLMLELEKPLSIQNDSLILFIAGKQLSQRTYFLPAKGTYEQIKESGYLRYFNQDIGFNLVKYEKYLNLLTMKLEIENKFVLENILPFTIKNLNQKFLRTTNWNSFDSTKEILFTNNLVFQNVLYGQTLFLQQRSINYTKTLRDLDSLSGICINLLKEEYHLK